jgi:hypothetical protein
MIGTAIAIVIAISAIWAAPSNAAIVNGVYTSTTGTPLASHQLHFENRISADIYLTHTGADGSFSSELPPGIYDLRAEHGLIIKKGIKVDRDNVSIGRVDEGAPLDARRPFEWEAVAPPILSIEAPATAHADKLIAAPAQSPNPSATNPIKPVPN